jgi:hypothetical protein
MRGLPFPRCRLIENGAAISTCAAACQLPNKYRTSGFDPAPPRATPRSAGLTLPNSALYASDIRYEAWKPVQTRHGRATVIGSSVAAPG